MGSQKQRHCTYSTSDIEKEALGGASHLHWFWKDLFFLRVGWMEFFMIFAFFMCVLYVVCVFYTLFLLLC